MSRLRSRHTGIVAAFGGVALLYAAFQVGCWNTAVTTDSPDHRHTVRIRELCLGPDCTIKAQLSSGLLPVEVMMRGDAWLGFVHITWSTDSSRVGLFVTNRLGGQPIQAGFDVRTNAQVPFETVRDMVADDIRRTYGLTVDKLSAYNGDALEWALRDPTAYERSLRIRHSRPSAEH